MKSLNIYPALSKASRLLLSWLLREKISAMQCVSGAGFAALVRCAMLTAAIVPLFFSALASGVAQAVTPSAGGILYGTAYYPEYLPSGRMEEDIALMKKAHFNVVRMGESTWSLWEPRDGQFEYEAMDRVIAAMHKAGIQVILGTPTYSVPVWLYAAHPEIMVQPLNSQTPVGYGARQNMDFSNPVFRQYAERLIRNLAAHYRDNPAVIGWQIDNETASYDAANPDVFQGFVDHLHSKFQTVEALNQAWLLNYWGQTIDTWEHVPRPGDATSPSYKLEWSRWQQQRVTDYLAWQAKLVRENARPAQFVIQDFAGAMHNDVNEFQVAKNLDAVAVNSYHDTQDAMNGEQDLFAGDFMRSLKEKNYLVTETNAQTTDWTSAFQYPPYDGQLRLNAYTHISAGAAMVEYWHWHSIHGGQEMYWKGILSHDLQPNRAYAEIERVGEELDRLAPHLQGLKVHNQAAILYSVDSSNALRYMPFTHSGPQWSDGGEIATYPLLVRQLYSRLSRLNVGVDFVFPEDPHLDDYKLLIVPGLYVADDALLKRITDYVSRGGHVLMTFKSGFVDENSIVRPVMAPGPLREAAGFHYQEFSSLRTPLALKDDPFQVGEENRVQYWAEFLVPDHAHVLASYDHPFFGKWAAITRNNWGKGTLTYEGTWLSDGLQAAVLRQELSASGISFDPNAEKSPVRIRSAVNAHGQRLHFYLNFSSVPQDVIYNGLPGSELLSGRHLDARNALKLPPWGALVVEESASASSP